MQPRSGLQEVAWTWWAGSVVCRQAAVACWCRSARGRRSQAERLNGMEWGGVNVCRSLGLERVCRSAERVVGRREGV